MFVVIVSSIAVFMPKPRSRRDDLPTVAVVTLSASEESQALVHPPRARRQRASHFTVKLTEDKTVPASSVTSTLHFPAVTALEVQVRVEGYLTSRAFSKTFWSPRNQRCLIVVCVVWAEILVLHLPLPTHPPNSWLS